MPHPLLLIALLLAPLAALQAAEPKTANKPNVIVILSDDLGWADLSCYGSTFHELPNLDKLAAQGMRFTQAYSSSPYCSPSRAAIMTGRHPARLKITDY
jgi:arylsulfatase A